MGDAKEFRKKPVVIQAIQWDGTLSGMDEILSVFTDIRTVAKTSHQPTNTCSFWKIGTLEGSHEVSAHDFVIRGVKGEYYPCKPDIFFMTYEPATATPPADAAGAARALSMLSSAALDHYTPYMVCVPTEKWVEAFALAGSLEITPPADAALADDALIELVTDYAQSKVRAESCLYRYESAEYDKEAAETLEQIRAALRARQPAQAVAVPEGVTEVRYLTDDRDLPQEEQHELVIRMSRNHDWYVMVVQKGHRFGPAVRLCTSGGASSHAPGLCPAIAEAFRAIAASKGGAT